MKFVEDYCIRLCKPEDAETDAAILAPLIQAYTQQFEIHQIPDTQSLTDLVFSLLSTGFSEFVIAEIENKPVGCLQINYRLSTREAVPYAFIDDVYVESNPHTSGITRSMVDYACQRADARGCAYVDVDILPDDTRSKKFYERMGFDRYPGERFRCRMPRQGRCGSHTHTHEEEEE